MSKRTRREQKERKKLLNQADMTALSQNQGKRAFFQQMLIAQSGQDTEIVPPQDAFEQLESLGQIVGGLDLAFDALNEQAAYTIAGSRLCLNLLMDLKREVQALRQGLLENVSPARE